MHIHIYNGPNLDQLERRPTRLYGHVTYEQLTGRIVSHVRKRRNVTIDVRQTADEARYLHWIHTAQEAGADALIVNPAGWSHTSYAIADAIELCGLTVIEVHFTDPTERERPMITAAAADHLIVNQGVDSYLAAIDQLDGPRH